MSPQLLAWLTALAFAFANTTVRHGLQYSTPLTATYVSLTLHTVVLGIVVYFTVGVPPVALMAVAAICLTGLLQPFMRFFHYLGLEKIGASRGVTLRNTHPILSVFLGITVLGEPITTLGIVGTALVVIGVFLTSWRIDRQFAAFRWSHVAYPLLSAFLTGVIHPLRRYALLLSNEPLFLAAVVGPVSLAAFALFNSLVSREKLVWDRRAVWPFIIGGFFETLAILLMLMAFAFGPVVVVSPIVATTPIWTVLVGALLMREIERITPASVMGTVCVVAGVIAISLIG